MQRMVWRRTTSIYCTVVHRGASAGQGHYYCVGRHSNHSQAAAGSSGSAADGVPSLPSYSSPAAVTVVVPKRPCREVL